LGGKSVHKSSDSSQVTEIIAKLSIYREREDARVSRIDLPIIFPGELDETYQSRRSGVEAARQQDGSDFF
jgi:hypothetical protein